MKIPLKNKYIDSIFAAALEETSTIFCGLLTMTW